MNDPTQRHEARYGCPPVENGIRPKHRCKAPWWVRVEAGYTTAGKRKRKAIMGKTRAECVRNAQKFLNESTAASLDQDHRTTIKRYAEQWLAVHVTRARPKTVRADTAAINKWIIPTIGHRKIAELAPVHVRELERTQRDAGLKGSTAAATQRVLMKMLREAERDGHNVPRAVLAMKPPTVAPSDRQPIPLEDVAKILEYASSQRGGLRWLLAIVYGWRQSEVLGLTVDSFDFVNEIVYLDWQVQQIPYREPRNPKSGFKMPHDFEARHLVDSWHLVRPKSKAGVRSAPIPPELVPAIQKVISEIENPYGLLFAGKSKGKGKNDPLDRPRNDKADRQEWWDIQEAVGVQHPSGRPYKVHECRNTAASRMRVAGGDDLAVTEIMGHTSIDTTRIYQKVEAAGQRALVGAVLQDLRPDGLATGA